MNKEKTIGGLLEEARKKSGAPKLAGYDIMDPERFAPNTRHMVVFDVLSHESPVGFKGERMRPFLTDERYKKAPAFQGRNEIRIRNHARVTAGHLHYDHKDRDFQRFAARKGVDGIWRYSVQKRHEIIL